MKRILHISIEKWPIRGVFRISRGSSSSVKVVVVELEQDGCIGRGETSPERYGMAAEIAVADMEAVRDVMEQGCERSDLQNILPPGPVRNGLDLALWDLEAKLTGRPVWDLAGLEEWRPVATAWTVSLDTPERMLQAAKQHQNRPLLKIKLTGESDLERVQGIQKTGQDRQPSEDDGFSGRRRRADSQKRDY